MKSIDYSDGWNEKLMGQLGEFRNGIDFSSDQQGSGTKIINVNDLYESAYVDLSNLNRVDISEDEIRRFRLDEDDIIFGRSSKDPDGVGQAVLFEGFEEPVTHAGFTIRMRPDTQVLNPYFFVNWLRSPKIRQRVISLGREATLTNISQDDLSKIKVPIPEFEEQRRIASVLYSVDEQIRTLTDRHDSLTQLKHGLMQDLLTGETKITPEMDVNEEVEEEPAVVKDEDWSKETLTDVADVVMGNSPDSEYYNEEKDGKPFLQGNNEFSYRKPNPDRWCSVDKKIAEKGDIMVSIRAPVGDTNIADTDYVIGRGLASVSSEVINHEFLYHLISYNQPYLERISVGSTFDSISSREFNYVEVSVPPLWEQERIASVLYTVDEMIARTSDLIDEYERLKRGLMQDLLSGDVRTPEHLTVLDEISTDASNSGTGTDGDTQRTLDV